MIKKFHQFKESIFFQTPKDKIIQLCKKFNIQNYSINPDLSIDVEGTVDIHGLKLSSLPLRFSIVRGDFSCAYNNLTSLEGCPIEVRGLFFCSNNRLTTLGGGPREVGKEFACNYNYLTTLEGGPREVSGDFDCSNNKITTLEGSPNYVGGYFNCSNNNLTTLDRCPDHVRGDFNCRSNNLTTLGVGHIEAGGNFLYFDNPVSVILNKFPDHKEVLKFWDDFDVVRNGNEISAYRFKEMYFDLTGEEFKGDMDFKGYKVVE